MNDLHDQDKSSILKDFHIIHIFKKTLYGYLSIIILSLLIIHFAHYPISSIFLFHYSKLHEWLILIGLTIGISLASAKLFSLTLKSFETHQLFIIRALGPLTLPACVYMALISALAEELLFRGAIQPFFGVGLTAIIASLLHISSEGFFTGWTAFSLVANFLLCLLFYKTNSLLPSLLANFLMTITFLCSKNYYLYCRVKAKLKQIAENNDYKQSI